MSTTEEAAGGYDDYDRLSELKAFDGTKAGVKGLVDAGVTTVPAIFRRHRQDGPPQVSSSSSSTVSSIPVIDLSAASADAEAATREHVVAQVKAAAETVGFFQLVNHGVPGELLSEMLASVRRFNEASPETKRPYYTRDARRKLRFNSNFDLFQSPAANWRDTLYLRMAPDPPAADELPAEISRDAIFEYAKQVKDLGDRLLELLSESLGLKPSYLADIECNQGQIIVGHYYPPCPQPEVAIGTSRHSDSGFLTILLQDGVGGLQILHDDQWVDVTPTPGAFIVNIGDLLQLISNDKFSSVEHRVVAKDAEPRVSIVFFFNTRFHPASTRMYGPIKELLSEENPPLYKETLVREFYARYHSIGLDGKQKTALADFRL